MRSPAQRRTTMRPPPNLLASTGLAIALAIMLAVGLGGCSAEAPSPAAPKPTRTLAEPTPNPEPAPVKAAPSKRKKKFDSLGRLVERAQPLWGIPLPDAVEETSRANGAVFFDIRTRKPAIVEFYVHRKFTVVEKPRGYNVLPNANTLEHAKKAGWDLTGAEGAKLHIRPIANNRFSLRLFRGELDRTGKAAPAKNTASAEPVELPPTQHRAYVPNSKQPTRAAPPKTFNPGVPRGVGSRSVDDRIEAWKKANPNKPFHD